jgi:hypothetical protein
MGVLTSAPGRPGAAMEWPVTIELNGAYETRQIHEVARGGTDPHIPLEPLGGIGEARTVPAVEDRGVRPSMDRSSGAARQNPLNDISASRNMDIAGARHELNDMDGEAPNRRLYETAVLATLRDKLRSGDI